MTPELSQRIAQAMNKGHADLEERQKIVSAVDTVKSDKFGDLPRAVQRLIRELETRPQPTWVPTRKVKK